jgi:16S rRNA processing protein RimM
MKLVPVAQILKPRGVRGEVWVRRFRESFPEFDTGSILWVGSREFAVENFFEYAKGAVLKLGGVNNKEDAQILSGLELLLPQDQVPEDGPDDFDTAEVTGFVVRDRARGVLGAVAGGYDGPAYWTFTVKAGDGVVEIPAVKGLGVLVDKTLKEILVDLPEGYPGLDEVSDED